VPHRELHLLPFAALPTGLGDALIDRVAIYYTPSASVLRYTRARRPDRGAADRVLGIGNPDLGTRQFDLPFAEREARRLRFDYPDARIVTGAEATETWLVENAADFSIIHIASHGQFDPDSPLSSRILLAADDRNSGDLSAEEVFALRMRADLIALSACQSGLGRLSAGDEIIGLNRAFVYAGSRQILTTLWRVDDVATALLFKHFYRNARTMDRAEAMRRSQLLLRSRPEYAHPVYWAPLVLSGDWY
jgi:CHAT domain-containing protein